MSDGLQAKRILVSAVGERLRELVPFLSERDCDDFLELGRRLYRSAERAKEELARMPEQTLDELLAITPPSFVSAPPRKQERRKRSPLFGSGDEIAVEPWDMVTHSFVKRVVTVDDRGLVIEATKRANRKVRGSYARVAFDQVSSIGKRQWPCLMQYFALHGLPVELENTPFGQWFLGAQK